MRTLSESHRQIRKWVFRPPHLFVPDTAIVNLISQKHSNLSQPPFQRQLPIHGIVCGFSLNSRVYCFNVLIISCSFFTWFLYLPLMVPPPQPCPHPLQRKSKLLSITFKTLQNLTPIQPSDFTCYCALLHTQPFPSTWSLLTEVAMLSNVSDLDIIMAVLQSSYASGVSALFFSGNIKKDKGGGYVCLSYTLPSTISLLVLSRSTTQPAPSIPQPSFIRL